MRIFGVSKVVAAIENNAAESFISFPFDSVQSVRMVFFHTWFKHFDRKSRIKESTFQTHGSKCCC